MSYLLDLLRVFINNMLELFSFGRKKISNKLPIFIKTNTGQKLSLNLDLDWKIEELKKLVAPQLGVRSDEVISLHNLLAL